MRTIIVSDVSLLIYLIRLPVYCRVSVVYPVLSVRRARQALMVFQARLVHLGIQGRVVNITKALENRTQLTLGKSTDHVTVVIQDRKYAVVSCFVPNCVHQFDGRLSCEPGLAYISSQSSCSTSSARRGNK